MASESKKRIDNGYRLPEYSHEPRTYYCRQCGKSTIGVRAPTNWYALQRFPSVNRAKPHRLGLFCSLQCLVAQMPRFISVEYRLGDDWESAVDEYGQE